MDAMTCERFEALASDWLDDELAPETLDAMETHRGTCAACAALVSDLRRIQADARQLSPLVPSRDLWADIEARIEAPVIPLAETVAADDRSRRRARAWQVSPRWLAAAAAGLVVLSSSVTYLLTRADAPAGELGTWVITGTPESPGTSPLTTPATASLEEAAIRATTDREIERLREAIARHGSRLDSATVATIERSLRVIDDAIAESRAALARDPANEFLNEQLDQTLQRKLELMRALALAPSRS
jgi:anti-sigma factor RsiW